MFDSKAFISVMLSLITVHSLVLKNNSAVSINKTWQGVSNSAIFIYHIEKTRKMQLEKYQAPNSHKILQHKLQLLQHKVKKTCQDTQNHWDVAGIVVQQVKLPPVTLGFHMGVPVLGSAASPLIQLLVNVPGVTTSQVPLPVPPTQETQLTQTQLLPTGVQSSG